MRLNTSDPTVHQEGIGTSDEAAHSGQWRPTHDTGGTCRDWTRKDIADAKKQMALDAKDNVLGDIRAEGPCSFKHLVYGVMDQCIGYDSAYDANEAVVSAINELTREGVIELYDTGDSWDLV